MFTRTFFSRLISNRILLFRQAHHNASPAFTSDLYDYHCHLRALGGIIATWSAEGRHAQIVVSAPNATQRLPATGEGIVAQRLPGNARVGGL